MSFKVSAILKTGEELHNRGLVSESLAAQIQQVVAEGEGGRLNIELEENSVAVIPMSSINYIKITKVYK